MNPQQPAAIYPGLKDKVALVTGAANGIGRATATLFAALGARVTIIDRDRDGVRKALDAMETCGQGVECEFADVTDANSCARAVTAIAERRGRIDILVNTVGVIRRADITTTSEEEWDLVLNVNLKSVFLMAREVIPKMHNSGGGSIVNVASGWGLSGGARAAAYCAAKGGVVQLTRAMALDHAGDKIRVNCVCPGDTNTPMLQDEARQLGLTYDALVAAGRRRPLGRIGEPEDIAAAIVYLSSGAAAFITGTTLIVDGGSLAGTP